MAKRKNGKTNKAKTVAVKGGKGKGKDAETKEAVDINDISDVYSDKYVTAKIDKGFLLIKCKLNEQKSGSGKSFTLVSLGGIKNGKCEQIAKPFGDIGGYFSVLCGYTQGAKE